MVLHMVYVLESNLLVDMSLLLCMKSMNVNPQSSTSFLFNTTMWTSVYEPFEMNFCMSSDLVFV